MYSNILLIYFSGTGNTRIITEHIAEEFRSNGAKVKILSIETLSSEFSFKQYDLIGIGHPVYGMSSPSILKANLKQIKFAGKDFFLFKTADVIHNVNKAGSKSLEFWIKKRGGNVISDLLYAMAANAFIKPDKERALRFYSESKASIKEDVRNILSNNGSLLKVSLFKCLFWGFVGYFEEKIGARFFGHSLYMDNSCSKCGLCEKKCPTGNISNLKFGWKCNWCMRCIYLCPGNSIKSRLFGFAIIEDGYDSKKLFDLI